VAPLVSILIVNHGYGRFLEAAIRSAAAQDYGAVECIVLDDGSRDESAAIARETIASIGRPDFRLVARPERTGQFPATVAALAEARGHFVVFLDSDDVLFPDFVMRHVEAHLNGGRVAAVSVSDEVQIDAGGHLVAGTLHGHHLSGAGAPLPEHWNDLTHERRAAPAGGPEPRGRLLYAPAWWSPWVPGRWIWATTSGLMFRKATLDLVTPARPEDLFGADAYLARACHSVGGTLCLDAQLGAYRRHGSNMHGVAGVLGGHAFASRQPEAESYAAVIAAFNRHLRDGAARIKASVGLELFYSMLRQTTRPEDFAALVAAWPDDAPAWRPFLP